MADEGARLEVDATLGRIMVARRSFTVGERVMAEQPLLVFDAGVTPEHSEQHNNTSYLRAFAEAPQRVQASVLDMFHPPLDKDTLGVVARRRLAREMDGIFGLSKELVHKLLMIRDTNCHAYTGHEEAYTEVVCSAFGGISGRASKGALFDLGSKVAHSCCPNVSYTSKTQHGGLEYIAVRPISEGEMLTYAYIDDLWTSTTYERRAKTKMEKDFVCGCARCVGPDTTCTVCCTTKSCAGFASPAMDQAMPADSLMTDRPWVCTKCGPLDSAAMEPVLQLERSLQGELERMQMHARHGEAIHPNAARGIAEHAARGLSPAHRLVARSYDMVATLCASHAAAAQRNGCRFGSQAKLRAESVEAAEKHTKVCECIAAGCHGGTRCSVPHPAVFQCAKVVYFAAQDLMEVPYRRRSSGAIQFITRYITHITTMYGEADDDVAKIKQMVQAGTEGTPRSATAIVHFCTPLMSPSCHQPTISHLHPQVPPPPPPWLPPASRAERRLGSSAAAGAKPYSFAMPRASGRLGPSTKRRARPPAAANSLFLPIALGAHASRFTDRFLYAGRAHSSPRPRTSGHQIGALLWFVIAPDAVAWRGEGLLPQWILVTERPRPGDL
jgi:hypothetical protein